MAENDDPAAEARELLLDIVRVGVGFAILTYQKVQVVRHDLETEVKKLF